MRVNKLKLNPDKKEIVLVQKSMMWVLDHHPAVNGIAPPPKKKANLHLGSYPGFAAAPRDRL